MRHECVVLRTETSSSVDTLPRRNTASVALRGCCVGIAKDDRRAQGLTTAKMIQPVVQGKDSGSDCRDAISAQGAGAEKCASGCAGVALRRKDK